MTRRGRPQQGRGLSGDDFDGGEKRGGDFVEEEDGAANEAGAGIDSDGVRASAKATTSPRRGREEAAATTTTATATVQEGGNFLPVVAEDEYDHAFVAADGDQGSSRRRRYTRNPTPPRRVR